MTRRQLVTIGAYAMATCALTVAVFWPGALEATGEGKLLPGEIQRPKLTINGCELSLIGEGTYQEGESPVFQLVAVNTGSSNATVNWTATMTSMQLASLESRRMPSPTMLWKTSDSLVLAPCETKTLTLATGTKLPKGSITVSLASEKQGVVAMQFSIGKDTARIAARRLQPQQPQRR